LPAAVRGWLGAAFGVSVDDVRVRRDPASEGLTRALDATAVTVGRQVYLAADAPAVDEPAGRRLIAHEVAHVLQQRAGVAAAPSALTSRPDGPDEMAAEAAADAVVAGVSPAAPVPATAPVQLARTKTSRPGTRGVGSGVGKGGSRRGGKGEDDPSGHKREGEDEGHAAQKAPRGKVRKLVQPTENLESLDDAKLATMSYEDLGRLLDRDDVTSGSPLALQIQAYRFALDVQPSIGQVGSTWLADNLVHLLTEHAPNASTLTDATARKNVLHGQPPPVFDEHTVDMIWLSLADTPVAKDDISGEDQCEHRAHAICELVADAMPEVAVHNLVKVWAVPPEGMKLHATTKTDKQHKWTHHVAAGVVLPDNTVSVLDPLLAYEPMSVADWSKQVKLGTDPIVAPWELLGRPVPNHPIVNLESIKIDADARDTIDKFKTRRPPQDPDFWF
jgi:hypothetical protein